MKLEIEMKARVADRAAVEAALRARARFVRDFDKADAYYLFPGAAPGEGRTFRIRSDGGSAGIVTWKERSRSEGLEVNKEHEFEVGEPGELAALCLAMGAREYFTKRKRGSEWAWGAYRAELAEVPPLGLFLEVEIVVEEAEAARAGEIRRAILDIFAACGLGEEAVEDRYYSAMLREAGALAWEGDA